MKITDIEERIIENCSKCYRIGADQGFRQGKIAGLKIAYQEYKSQFWESEEFSIVEHGQCLEQQIQELENAKIT